ncbi:unnamed protein product [Closterium sp. NIES-53]
MASLRVPSFDPEGRPVAFDTWHNDLQLYLLSDLKDSVSLFDHVSGAAPAPPATADISTRSQTAQTLYDAVVARYSSPATAAIGRLLLPYLFPELSAFATVADLVTHLRTSDARYRAAVPAEDHFLTLDPTSLTVDLLEQHLLAVETSAAAMSLFLRTLVLLRLVRSAATAKGKGGRGSGGGSGGGGGGSGSASGGSGRGGGGGVGGGGGGTGGGGGGSGGGGGGSGGSGGSGGGGTSGDRSGPQRGGPSGGRGQQQRRRSETQTPPQLRECLAQRGAGEGSETCPYVIRTGARAGRTCKRFHTERRCFARLDDAWRAEFGDDVERPRWAQLLQSGVSIFDLDFDVIISAIGGVGDGGGGRSGSGGGRSRSHCGAVQWGASGGGQLQLQQSQHETLSPRQLREWLFQRGTSRSSARCPYVIRTGDRAGQTCGTAGHTQSRCFSFLSDTWRVEFGDAAELPRWLELLRQGVDVFALDYDAIISAMHALSLIAEGDCYRTILTPLPALVMVRLADPSGGPVIASSSTVLPCPAVPSGSLSGLHLPFFSTNLVSTAALQDAMVTTTTPGGSSLYTLAIEPSQVAASAKVSASGQVAASCSCRLLSHQTLLWHHRLCHPSLPRLRGMHSRFLVSGLPRSLPPLQPSPARPCLPCVEGRQRAAPHSSSFPLTTAPLQTLHMDVLGPARVSGQGHERYFLLVVDDYTRYTMVFPLRSKGKVVDVLIPWIRTVRLQLRERFGTDLLVLPLTEFAVRYAAHQLNLWPRVSLPETSPTLRWMGKVDDASVFRVWGSRAFVRDTSADKLSARAIPCVFLGFVPDAPGWQFYHPTSRRVLPSQDVTFDESVPFYRLFPYRSAPPPPPPLFLALGPPPVDPLPPQGPAPSGVSQVDPLPGIAPVQVAVGSGAARGATSGGAASGGAEPGGAGSEGAGSGGVEPGGAEREGVEPGGAELEGAESGGAALSGGPAGASPRLSSQQLLEWLVRHTHHRSGTPGAGGAGDTGAGGAAVPAGAGGTGGAAATGPGGARTSDSGAAGTGGVGCARAGDPTEPRVAGAVGAGAEGAGVGGPGAGGAGAAGAGVGGTGARGARPAGARGADPGAGGAGGTVRPRPYFVPRLQQSSGLIERRETASRPVSPVHNARRTPRSRPPPVPGTHAMALRPSSVPLRVPLLAPPESSLPEEDFECLAAAVPCFASMLLASEGDLDAPDIPTPHSYAEAITGPSSSQWQAAMDAKMASWKSTGTYIDELLPPRANIVDGMWIFRVKRPPGTPPAFKARYVARGFSQRQGVDYFQTFSPTPKMTTLRVLLHVAAQRDYELNSLDFSTAFLQGSLHEEIWLRRAPGFTGSFPVGTQWSLRWPVYGLRQASREWHDTLRTTLAALGFAPSTADPSLFLRIDPFLPPFYVLVYVEDLVFATADTQALTLVLQHFGFQFSSPQPTPLSTSHLLSAPPLDEFVEPSGPYPELVGCLMYLMTCTRPDLAYFLSLLARYVAPSRHEKVHWDAAKWVLRYLLSTSGMGLVLGGRGLVVLTGHADASWVDDSATQRSSQGYTFSLGSGSVSWQSTRSSSVLSSSCEAEVYAGAMAAQELRWLTYLLTDLGEQPRSPPVLYVDNKAMIALCQEHRLEHRTKHIALRYFLARELQQRGHLRLAYVASRAKTDDVFTKALPPCDHQRFSTVLGIVHTLPHLLTA